MMVVLVHMVTQIVLVGVLNYHLGQRLLLLLQGLVQIQRVQTVKVVLKTCHWLVARVRLKIVLHTLVASHFTWHLLLIIGLFLGKFLPTLHNFGLHELFLMLLLVEIRVILQLLVVVLVDQTCLANRVLRILLVIALGRTALISFIVVVFLHSIQYLYIQVDHAVSLCLCPHHDLSTQCMLISAAIHPCSAVNVPVVQVIILVWLLIRILIIHLLLSDTAAVIRHVRVVLFVLLVLFGHCAVLPVCQVIVWFFSLLLISFFQSHLLLLLLLINLYLYQEVALVIRQTHTCKNGVVFH